MLLCPTFVITRCTIDALVEKEVSMPATLHLSLPYFARLSEYKINNLVTTGCTSKAIGMVDLFTYTHSRRKGGVSIISIASFPPNPSSLLFLLSLVHYQS